MNATDWEMAALIVGGFVGLTLLPSFPDTGPFSWKAIIIAAVVIIAAICLVIGLYDAAFND